MGYRGEKRGEKRRSRESGSAGPVSDEKGRACVSKKKKPVLHLMSRAGNIPFLSAHTHFSSPLVSPPQERFNNVLLFGYIFVPKLNCFDKIFCPENQIFLSQKYITSVNAQLI